ncbi:methyl-accepting chemotaxis protein [Paenibacillus sp. DMB20]|uniref:methyl-accepting chemotaxis protein n=1 Tax=Paenibacillus sp. DMB20 TaxID=1642570 RepID=UPI00062757D0|nr:methyl-accepting chemotaxis protein [Paenibacillus sp. DMB20]KKO54702.1 hypothetical protein XI25_05255 [Paenibacillus sp. DMB20]
MKKKGAHILRRNMIITYLLVLLVPSATIGFMTYNKAQHTVEDEIMRSARQSVQTADRMITQNINAKKSDLDYFSGIFKAEDINAELDGQSKGIANKLKEYLALHPEILEIFIGTSDGGMLSSSSSPKDKNYDPRKRDWYALAMKEAGKTVLTAPYKTASGGGEIVVTIAQQLPNGKGVIGVDLNLHNLRKLMESKVGKEGYTTVLDQNGKYLLHPEYEAGIDAIKEEQWISKLYEKPDGQLEYENGGKSKQLVYMTNDLTGWKVAGTMFTQEVTDEISGIRNTMLTVVGLALLAAAPLVTWNISSVMRPIRRLHKATEIISGGDLSQRLEGFKRNEIGDLADNFQLMVDNLRNMILNVQEMTANVSASSEQLSASSEESTKSVEHVTQSIQEVAAGSESQLTAVEEGLESMGLVARNAASIADMTTQVSGVMSDTNMLAQEGNTAVATAAETMHGIHETVGGLGLVIDQLQRRTEEIGGIVGVIAEIAQQTNLLALNASIEAARAGEHGRGFAVVASEVRRLAEGSETSAKHIHELISGILHQMQQAITAMDNAKQKVEEGVGSIDATGRSFSRIRKAVKNASAKVEDAAAAAQELAQGAVAAEQSIHAIRGISEETAGSTQSISAASEEQLASMEEIAASATDLSRLSEQLQELAGRFKI